MESANHVKNFGGCQLGDLRLNRRALSIGKALSQKFGQALSTIFEDAKELKGPAGAFRQKPTVSSETFVLQ